MAESKPSPAQTTKPAVASAPAAAAPASQPAGKPAAKPFDVKTPKFTGKDLVAGLRNQIANATEKRLAALARRDPAIAKLMKEQNKTK